MHINNIIIILHVLTQRHAQLLRTTLHKVLPQNISEPQQHLSVNIISTLNEIAISRKHIYIIDVRTSKFQVPF